MITSSATGFFFLFIYKRLAPLGQYLANIFGILSTLNLFVVGFVIQKFDVFMQSKMTMHLAIFSFMTSVYGKVCGHDWSIIKILLEP